SPMQISVLRRAGRRLTTLVLALAASCTLVSTIGVTPAHAQPAPNSDWTAVDWHLETYADWDNGEFGGTRSWDRRNQYNLFISDLRDAVSQRIGGTNNDRDLMDTRPRQSAARDRIIEVRVWTNLNGSSPRSDLALYFNASNLYLVGFTSHARHYQFQDTSPRPGRDSILRNNLGELYRISHNLPAAPVFQDLGYTGNYNSLDRSENRQNFRYLPANIMDAVNQLNTSQPLTPNALRPHLAVIIGMTAEAARFGWIERR
ncbi:hypothetical protein GTW69_18015, partial [Streptomyces sp. SID7760]|nr:hypothetical protein [Streptomyces sp. SID7760]